MDVDQELQGGSMSIFLIRYDGGDQEPQGGYMSIFLIRYVLKA